MAEKAETEVEYPCGRMGYLVENAGIVMNDWDRDPGEESYSGEMSCEDATGTDTAGNLPRFAPAVVLSPLRNGTPM